MKKKFLAALLVIAMAASLVACSSNQTPKEEKGSVSVGGNAESGSASTAESSDAASVDTSEHVVITYMTTGDKPSITATDEMMAELNKILTEKVNAELQIYYIGWTDYLSNYNLTLAQMDGTVDLVGTASDWLDAWPNAKNGAFMKLSDDMLKTYAPKTWESVSPEHWELCKYDGDIYLMPEDNYAQWTNHGFIYRLDWAKEAGLANGIHRWEDMTAYFKYVKEAYPDIIPWDSDGTHHAQLASGWLASHSNYVAIEGIASGGLWGGTRGDLYTITTPSYTDTQMMVDFANMMKEWDTIGVWKTDVLNNTASSNRDDYRIGRVAAEQHHTQTWTDLVSHTNNNTIYKDDPDADSGFFYFGEETKNVTALSITHGAMAISAASKNPERALMVYDLLRNDPDCYKLFNYGVEGRQWELTGEGLRQQPASYNKDVDEIVTNFWWGRNDDLEIKDASRNWDAIDAMYAEYDKIKIDYPYGQFVPDVDNIQAQINNINEIHTNYMKQISFGKFQGTAEDIVAEYQAALKAAGMEEVTAELQRQFDELYK